MTRLLRAGTVSAVLALLFVHLAHASLGDRLPDFQRCIAECERENCGPDGPGIPLHRQLLLWTCPKECDYTCQHVITNARKERYPPFVHPVVQFHGKWPFHRFLGMQEPFSVLFSLCNLLAHKWGLRLLRSSLPANYPFLKYYLGFGYCGLISWTASIIFHTRDFNVTEKMDYFAAALSIFYGLYYTPIRLFRLLDDKDAGRKTEKESVLRIWTGIVLIMYVSHVSYLAFWRFDYTYNMLANVVVGIIQNLLWSVFSVYKWKQTRRTWAIWPGLIVAWIVLAMSLELFDFPPWHGMLDAHSLWHLGTVVPTIWWYLFLVKDAREDIQEYRLKA